jgi:hypothetical protein
VYIPYQAAVDSLSMAATADAFASILNPCASAGCSVHVRWLLQLLPTHRPRTACIQSVNQAGKQAGGLYAGPCLVSTEVAKAERTFITLTAASLVGVATSASAPGGVITRAAVSMAPAATVPAPCSTDCHHGRGGTGWHGVRLFACRSWQFEWPSIYQCWWCVPGRWVTGTAIGTSA